MNTYYKINKLSLVRWYNLVGLNVNNIKFNGISTEARHLDELSPYSILNCSHQKILSMLPETSYKINEIITSFLEKTCELNNNDLESSIYQIKYITSFMGILNIVSSLNLIPDDSQDYVLHFKRLNSVLLSALASLDGMDEENVCRAYAAIKTGSAKNIYTALKDYTSLFLFVLLALNNNPDSRDYEIFENDESDTINYDNLYKLALDNLKNVAYDGEIPINAFYPRLSFEESIRLSR